MHLLYATHSTKKKNESQFSSPLLGGQRELHRKSSATMAPRFGSGFFSHKMIEEAEAEEEEIEELPPAPQPNPSESTEWNDVAKLKKLEYIKTFLKFAVMGAGANWVYPSALAQEIPYFQRTQPEGHNHYLLITHFTFTLT